MRSKFPNHARNVWDRAVALLPRVDQFWYKYSYMEVRGSRESFGALLWFGVCLWWMSRRRVGDGYGIECRHASGRRAMLLSVLGCVAPPFLWSAVEVFFFSLHA